MSLSCLSFCPSHSRVFLESGCCHNAPQPTVRPDKTEVCNFSKIKGQSSGAVGVLTYGLLMRGDKVPGSKVAIMFSVPFDYNLYKNWVAVGIYDAQRETDEALYKEMYYAEENKFTRSEASGSVSEFRGEVVDIMCTMSPMGRAIMKVEVWEKIFSAPEAQQQGW